MKQILVSVDTGKQGACSVTFDGKVQEMQLYNLDCLGDFISHMVELKEQVDSLDGLCAVVEQPPKFTGNFSVPSSASFVLGQSYGEVCGVLRTLGYPMHLVRPQEWQRGLSGLKGLRGHPRKRVLADHARRLLPNARITIRNADAALISHQFLNNTN